VLLIAYALPLPNLSHEDLPIRGFGGLQSNPSLPFPNIPNLRALLDLLFASGPQVSLSLLYHLAREGIIGTPSPIIKP
jgi:hypothetical protein